MHFDLVIFDCDGVLVDSEPISASAFADSLAEIGLPISETDVWREFTGLSLASSYRLIEERWGVTLPDDFHETMQGRTLRRLGEAVEAVPGVRKVIDDIDAVGGAKCVASSGNMDKMRVTLGRTELLPLFDGCIFSAWHPDVKRGKPFPDLFLHAAGRMGVEPARCAVIEDSVHGVNAAHAAGMTAFGYVGGSPSFDLAAEGATEFASMSALPDLLGLDR